MPAWACLLRGVNLGKHRKLLMPALRDALVTAGMTDVRTYLPSGNIVIQSPLRTHAQVSRQVHGVIAAEFPWPSR